jgi:hypothetical protein
MILFGRGRGIAGSGPVRTGNISNVPHSPGLFSASGKVFCLGVGFGSGVKMSATGGLRSRSPTPLP